MFSLGNFIVTNSVKYNWLMDGKCWCRLCSHVSIMIISVSCLILHGISKSSRVFYLWGNLKSKVYSSNPHSSDELENSICETIRSVDIKLKRMSNNLFKRCEICLRAEGRHSEHLLWWFVLLNSLFTLRNAHWCL
jgi:hypothetical protein